MQLGRDCHVCYDYAYYSAPFDYYQQTLWLKATPTTITIYCEHQRVAHHARLFEKGGRQTVLNHLPPKARYYLKRDPTWCLAQSEEVGESCAQLIQTLLNDNVRDLLRQAQSILSLLESYGKTRLEKACRHALSHRVMDYRTIKAILEKGIDEQVSDTRSHQGEIERGIYQGQARFQREIKELTH